MLKKVFTFDEKIPFLSCVTLQNVYINEIIYLYFASEKM